MKHSLTIMFIFFILMANKSIGQTDTTLQKLVAINYEAYNGHTVDSLVKNLPKNYSEMIVSFTHRVDYGDVLSIKYPNDIYVEIHVSYFKYMNPWLNKTNKNLSPKVNWDVNLFKKEKISHTIVYSGINCKAGCKYDPQATAP